VGSGTNAAKIGGVNDKHARDLQDWMQVKGAGELELVRSARPKTLQRHKSAQEYE
jgi:hypothetical protein